MNSILKSVIADKQKKRSSSQALESSANSHAQLSDREAGNQMTIGQFWQKQFELIAEGQAK